MENKMRMLKKLAIVFVCLSMLFNGIYSSAFTVSAAGNFATVNKVADPSTMDEWQTYFGKDANGNYSTENAGGIWADKSVFSDDSAFNGKIQMNNEDENFVVALSALASNKEIVGYTALPTDTMLVLDLSNSMSDSNLTAMVRATNQAIEKLLNLNPNNRVGVSLYSGVANTNTLNGAATVILPLSHYTTTSTVSYGNTRYNEYVEFESGKIRTARTTSIYGTVLNVTDTTTNQTVDLSKNAEGATYIQAGMWKLWQQFEAKIESNDTVVKEGIQAGTTRMPIVVLMSDGAPTIATTQYNNVRNSNSGNGQSSSATNANAFYTQLTNAWVKEKLEEGYGRDALFYTLGLGVSGDGIASSVMDPENSTSTIKGYWETFLNARDGATVNIGNKAVTKDATVKERDYVDEYFSANSADQLVEAFVEIVNQIVVQSKYYPTKIDAGKHNLGGYVTFVDELDDYMEVKDIKGIMIDDTTLYSGSVIAKEMTVNGLLAGASNSDYSNLTKKETALLDAVANRMNVSVDTVKVLITQALKNKQIYYNSDDDYKNTISWYASADGAYLGFWDGSDPYSSTTKPSNATYAVTSYGFFGTVNKDSIDETDMLYVTVQVRENLLTGRQSVLWRIPASLIPTTTYSVEFTGTSYENATNIKMKVDEEKPIRLIFEEGLKSSINELNIVETLGNKNRNADGTYSFYTNRWEYAFDENGNLKPAPQQTTTIVEFEPSLENERYYYNEDKLIYRKNGNTYTEVKDETLANDIYYHKHIVFKGKGGSGNSATLETVYSLTNGEDVVREDVAKNDEGSWYIKKGTTHRARVESMAGGHSEVTVEKTQNPTGTIHYSLYPTVTLPSGSEKYHADMFLGNNGKLTISPAQGIKITKSIDTIVPGASTAFEFKVALSGNNVASSYPVTTIASNGDISKEDVRVVNGVMTIHVHNKEQVYITGISDGTSYVVSESKNDVYKVKSVNGVEGTQIASGTIALYTLETADFVNTPHNGGNLIVRKNVEHPYGASYVMPDGIEFDVVVNLGVENANKEFELLSSEKIKTDASGSVTLTLKNGDAVGITGIPHGTNYSVSETNIPDGFSLNTNASTGLTGVIKNDENSAARLVNTYRADPVRVDGTIIHRGSKTLVGREWLTSDQFGFELQYFNGVSWQKIASSASVNSTTTSFSYSDVIKNLEYDEVGVYQYRIIETSGTIGGISYDTTEYHFHVIVTDNDMDGSLEISKVDITMPGRIEMVPGRYTIYTDFTNRYAPTGSAEVEFNIKKDVVSTSGVDYNGNNFSEFMFGLYNMDGELISTMYTDAAGNASGALVFSAQDLNGAASRTYTYVVREIVPSLEEATKGMQYTRHEYILIVNLVDKLDGTVEAQLQIQNGSTNSSTTVEDEEVPTLEFENVYDPLDTRAVISGTKTLANKVLTDGMFTFELYEEDATTPTLTATNVGNSFVFDAINYDKVGTYNYVVKEKNTGLGGITYDTNVYNVKVVVSDVEGELVANVTYTLHNNPVDAITFANTYSVSPTEFTLTGTKDLVGRTFTNEDVFEFELYTTDATYSTVGKTPLVASTVNGRVDDDTSTFNFALSAPAAGTYYYVLEEKAGTLGGVTYDTAHYHISVEVKDNGDGTLTAQTPYIVKVRHTDAGILQEVVDNVTFTNSYVATNKVGTTITATKQLTGRDLINGEFTFKLYSVDENWAIPQNATPIDTAVNVNSDSDKRTGMIAFDEIKYDRAGTYRFVVVEEDAIAIGGITFDQRKFKVEVVVSDDGNGNLVASAPRYMVENEDITSIVFENQYNITGEATATISGKKSYVTTGYNQSLREFSFILKDSSGKEVETVKNDRNGNFTFKALTFNKNNIGTHKYTVSEVNAGQTIDGITYDDVVYTVEITVSDNGKGGLNVSTVYKENNAVVEDILFENTYSVYGTTIAQIQGTKVLNGRHLNNGEFEFELYEADSRYRAGNLLQTKTNDGSHFHFEITYNKRNLGTHYYVVKEKSGNKGGVTYDPTVYNVKVVVTDTGRGTLSNTVYVNEQAGNNVTFTNKYTVQPTKIELTGTKQLVGRKLNDGEFAFELFETDSTYSTVGKESMETSVDKTSTNGGTFKFTLNDKAPGTYYFVLEEKAGTLGGVTYDTAHYHISVEVKDNGDGTSTQQAPVITKVRHTKAGVLQEAANGLTFTNTYTAVDNTGVSIVATKSLTGRELVNGEFTFKLYSVDENWAIPQNATPINTEVNVNSDSNKNTGTVTFDTIKYNFDQAGKSFYYIIVEENAGQTINGVTYTTVQYRVKVTVVDNGDGTLTPVVVYDKVADAGITTNVGIGALLFENTYGVDESVKVAANIQAHKTLNGNKTLVENMFAFELKDASGAVVQTVKNAANGAVTFAPIEYNKYQIGEHVYTISEVNAGKTIDGITYDSTVYTVKVNVSDNLKGGLDISVKYYLGSNEINVNDVKFVNTYATSGNVKVNFDVTKTLNKANGTDRALIDNEFTFYLFKTDANYGVSGAAVDLAYNTADGTVSFDELVFDQIGTYYYVMYESIPTNATFVDGTYVYHGVTYDAAKHYITIVVSDNGVGGYSATTTIDGYNTNKVDFTNTYNAKAANTSIKGMKRISGRALRDQEFTFELFATDETYAITGTPVLVTNNAKGEFVFENIAGEAGFTSVGTYYYVVKEQVGTTGGVTYDDTYYKVIVEVTDDGKGQLVAETSIVKVVTENEKTYSVDTDEITFINRYVATDKTGTILEVRKQLQVADGMIRKLEAGEFKFELFETHADYVIDKDAVSVATATNDENGVVQFLTNAGTRKYYTEAGVYYYSIREVHGDANGVIYDVETIEVEVTVTDNGYGTLNTSVKYHVNNVETQTPTFTNVYKPSDAEVTFKGDKNLSGRTLKEGEFTFELWRSIDDTYMVFDTAMCRTTNKADGSFAFDTLTYNAVGTYYYVLVETDDKQEGVVYDTTAYKIIVTVNDDGNGALYAEVSVDDTLVEDEMGISFNNTFTAKPIEVDVVSVQKKLINDSKETKSLEGFKFKLESAGNDPVILVSDANGKVTFTKVFTDADADKVFTYTLSEVDTDIDNMTYDTTTYTITVKVDKDENGVLSATITLDDKAVEKANVTFTNTYKPPVETGDQSMTTLYLTINMASILALLVVFFNRRKRMVK